MTIYFNMAGLYNIRGLLNKSHHQIWRSLFICSRLNATSAPEHQPAPKPFSECPGPKGIPIVGGIVRSFPYAKKQQFYLYWGELQKNYGQIVKEGVGFGRYSVTIFDPKDIEHLCRQEGKYPRRMAIEPWVEYRKLRGVDMGVLLSEGEDWQRVRTVVNPPLLKPSVVNLHTEDIGSVVDTMMERLEEIVKEDKMEELRDLLAKWAMESVSLYLFEQRIGSLDPNPPENCKELFANIKTVQATTMALMMLPMPLVKVLNLKMWKEHVAGWDKVFEITSKYCNPVIERVTKAVDAGEDVHGFIALLLKSGVSQKEIEANLSDFLAAGIDTSATAFSWALIYLSKNPDKQQKLYEEISKVIPSDGPITQIHLSQLRYLKAVFKEVLRIRPVVYGISRVLDHEIVLSGYRIPAGTVISIPTYTMGNDEAQVDQPQEFRPERWIRGIKEDIDPFSSLPFGHGARGCIGRRLAELELYLLMCKVIQKYSLESTGPVQERGTSVLEPTGPLNVKFHARK